MIVTFRCLYKWLMWRFEAFCYLSQVWPCEVRASSFSIKMCCLIMWILGNICYQNIVSLINSVQKFNILFHLILSTHLTTTCGLYNTNQIWKDQNVKLATFLFSSSLCCFIWAPSLRYHPSVFRRNPWTYSIWLNVTMQQKFNIYENVQYL